MAKLFYPTRDAGGTQMEIEKRLGKLGYHNAGWADGVSLHRVPEMLVYGICVFL